MSTDGPQFQIDDDWKAQAQAEKQQLIDKAREAKEAKAPAKKPAPKPSDSNTPASAAGADEAPGFDDLIGSFASQTLLYLGLIPDPNTGQRLQSLDHARHALAMLEVLEEKTQGNLSEHESNMLGMTLYELRDRYIQVAQASRPVPRD